MVSESLWLIGAGPMAQACASALLELSVPFSVIGRSSSSAAAFTESVGVPVLTGGLEHTLNRQTAPEQVIVAVGVEALAATAQLLLEAGTRRLLIEKPGALNLAELQQLQTLAQQMDAEVWIAYNRRFYASVLKLRELITADGGITSASFEFTEWSHQIRDLQKGPGVKEHWLLGNSSHVIDLAFDLIGFPAEGNWHAWHSGSLDWHPAAARFHGAGITEKNIPFSYQADWEAPGRWGIELLTRRNRYLLRPLESLQAIPLGKLAAETIDIDSELDQRFKPGVFRQLEAFITGDIKLLCSLSEQVGAFRIYNRIAGYSNK